MIRQLHPLSLLLLFAALLHGSLALAAGAGSVIYLAGQASIVGADGKMRVAKKSALINPGDTVATGKDGQVDLRFSDDTLLQLQAESRFRIDEYVFNGKADGRERAAYSLLKGAFRTVTGTIGKINKEAYAVTTTSAVIGIRGTDYTARLGEGLRVSVKRGEISLSNNAGSFAVAEGQSAYVRNADSAPVYQQAGDAGKTGGGGAGGSGSGSVQIRGNTRIDAQTGKTTATAAGRDNKAANQAGVIGGN